MATPVNKTTMAKAMMSAAPLSWERIALESQFILQALQVEVTIVDPNRLDGFGWNGCTVAGEAGGNNTRQPLAGVSKQNALPPVFHISNLMCSTNAPARRRRKVVHVSGQIQKTSRRSSIYQSAPCRIYYSDRHHNCLYIAEANACERCVARGGVGVPRYVSHSAIF